MAESDADEASRAECDLDLAGRQDWLSRRRDAVGSFDVPTYFGTIKSQL